MNHQGSCHCGAIRYQVETDLQHVMRCNCSLCGRTGTLMTFVPASALAVQQGEDSYVDYQFGGRKLHHGFCRTCGVRPYGFGKGKNGPMVMINVGCLEGVDTREYADVTVYDGASR